MKKLLQLEEDNENYNESQVLRITHEFVLEKGVESNS
jgi:hypothetical protein